MPIYKVGDKKYNVPQEELEGFLAEFPQAEEFTEGKTSTTEPDTTVDATEVSESTEFPLEPGSSGFTEEGEIVLSGKEVEEGSVALEPVALEEVVVTAEEYKQKEKDLQAIAVKEMFEKAGLEAPSIMEEKDEGSLSPITEFEETQRISADDKKQRDLREKERQYYADNPDKLSAKQSVFNSITNSLGQLSTVDDRAKWLGSYISSDIDLVRNLFPKKTADKILKSASKNLGEATANIDKVGSYGGKTIGFTELSDRDSLGSKAAGGLAATFNALSAFGTSAATNYLTFGVGLATDMIGGSVKSYNETKAADLGITVDQLIASGNAETLVPASLGALGYSLEKAGIKSVGKYINSLSNKGSKAVFGLMNVGNKEGTTEWFQATIEKFNENLAKGMLPDEAGLESFKYMLSPEGRENYYQGFVGGSGIAASGSALSSIRSKPNKERISKLISDLNVLEDQKFAKNLTEKEISLINESQNAIRLELKSTVNEANELLAVLPSESIESINKNADLLTSYNSQIQEINKDPKYTQEVKDLMISELVKKRDIASQNISDIRNQAERLVSNIARAKEASKDIEGLEFKDFANAKEIQEFLKDQDQNIDTKASGQQGFIIQDPKTNKQTIVINREVAAKESAMNVAGHELGHAIIFNAIKNSPDTAVNLGEALLSELDKIDSNVIKDSEFKKRMELYTNESNEVQMEEALTLFSDALATGDIQFKENIFTKIGDQIRRVLQSFGVKTKFNTGRDVYNFIKDYNKSLEKGKLSSSQVKLAKEGAEGELVAEKAKTDEQIIKESRSEEASARVQELYDTQGEAAAFDIIEQFKPITSKIVEKRSKAPGFDRQLLTDEIETGERGILDLIKEYKPEMKTPLAAWINKFLPARAIEASKRILGEEFTEDVTEAKGVAAEEASIEVAKTEKQATSKLRRVLGIKQGDDIYNLAKEVSGEILSGDLPGKKVKTAINREARKSKLRKAVSDLMGTEKAIDEQFLNKNILEILKALPASDLVKLERESKAKVLAEQGSRLNVKDAREAVNKGLLPKDTNLQSGPKVSSKLPTTLEQAKEFFTQKRKAGLVNVVTEMLVKDAAPEVTKDKMEPAKRAKVLSEIDRKPTLKFSLSTKQDLDWSIDEAENRNTSFSIGDKTYNVQLNAKDLGADQDADPTDYSLEFDQDGSQELTGKGDQFKALSIIYNGLIDEIKSNPNIATVSFNALASETSRVKLYDVLLDKLSKELGWTAEKFDYESDGVIDEIGFEMYKPEETVKEQPTVKFSKSINGLEGKNQSNFFNKLPITVEQIKALDLSIPNKSVLDEIQNILKDNLGQKFPKTKEISKDLFKVLSLYNKIDKQFKNANTALPITLEEMLFDSLKASEENTNLLKFLKIKGNLSNYYTVENINKQRQIPVEIATKMLSEGKSKEEVIKFLTLAKGMYASSSKIGKGNFKVVDGLVVEVFEGDQDYSFGSQRYQVFDSVKDYEDNVINQITGLKPTKIKLFPDTSKSAISDKNYEGRLDQAKDFRGVVDTIMLYMTDGIIDSDLPYTKVDLALVMAAMKSNMSAPLKKAANLKWIFEGGNIDVKDLRYEHLIPTNYMMLNLLDVYLNNKGNERTKKANELFKEYTVAVIPRSMDDTITDVGLQDVMNSDYKTGKDPISRYYNLRTFGNEFMFALKSIDPKDNGKIVGQEWANISKDKAIAAEKNNINLPAEDRLSQNTEYTNKDVLDKTKEKDKESLVSEMKFSKALNLNKDFNDIIENKTGIASDKTYARVKAEVAGANKGKFNFFIPPSAEDFVGLLYSTLGKGSTGDAQMAWYKAHLINPFARAMENIANDRVAMIQDYKGLKKALKIVPKDLRKKVPGEPFTREQAVRVYIWDQQGMEIPGLSKKDQSDLVKYVNDSTELTAFADQLIDINKGDEYASPDAGWIAGTIDTDFLKALNTTKRAKYLEVWQQNVDEIFSETNLNKLEAAYGKPYRVAMENILHRMKTGRNRSFGTDTITGRFTDWLTNSVGAIMFFNTRSAVLQTISAVNFINFSDNNVLKAGQAFANQPQYWSDFKKLFNSPFLLDRRSGIKLNVNEADIAEMAKGPGNSARNVIAGLLKAGFLPTQLADSFAIASGGASFYRNRIKALKKEGLTEAEAEEIAFRDFREIAEESQQSSRPDKISQQQAGPLGRVVLAFANTPAQYARLIKKAASDLKNGRGDAKTNISKIIYYGVAQNVLFSALQQALFAVSFGDDEEEENKRDEKYFNIANGMADSILRGIGVGGAIASVVKNTAIKLAKEEEKRSPKYQDVLVKEVLQISPPISSKVGKLRSAGRSLSWNKKEMMTKGWSIDNPAYLASANVISAVTNLPADRAVKKITNLVDASNEEIEYYKRIALALGWSSWELGIDKKDKKKPESSTGKTRTRTRRITRTKKRRN